MTLPERSPHSQDGICGQSDLEESIWFPEYAPNYSIELRDASVRSINGIQSGYEGSLEL